jgi:hypothetical protein
VNDQVGRPQGFETWIGKTAVTARQMGVRDQGEPKTQSESSARRSERFRSASLRSR